MVLYILDSYFNFKTKIFNNSSFHLKYIKIYIDIYYNFITSECIRESFDFFLESVLLSICEITELDLHYYWFLSNQGVGNCHHLCDCSFGVRRQTCSTHGLNRNFEIFHHCGLEVQLLDVVVSLVHETCVDSCISVVLFLAFQPYFHVSSFVGFELEVLLLLLRLLLLLETKLISWLSWLLDWLSISS